MLGRRHITSAHVIAVVALFVALGSSATAAVIITGRDIKDGTVSGADVRNRSLTAKDFKGSVAGAAGATGATGLAGPAGPAGPAGKEGKAGPAGQPGTNGTNGTNGKDGATGPAGPSYSAGSTVVQPPDVTLPKWERTKVGELAIDVPDGVNKLQINAFTTVVSDGFSITDCELTWDIPSNWISRQRVYSNTTTGTLVLGRQESGGVQGHHTLAVYCQVGTGPTNGAAAITRFQVVGTA